MDRNEDAMPCGCMDYHMADCPIVAPPADYDGDPYDEFYGERW